MEIPSGTSFLILLNPYEDPLSKLPIFIFDLLNASRGLDAFLSIFIERLKN